MIAISNIQRGWSWELRHVVYHEFVTSVGAISCIGAVVAEQIQLNQALRGARTSRFLLHPPLLACYASVFPWYFPMLPRWPLAALLLRPFAHSPLPLKRPCTEAGIDHRAKIIFKN